MEKTLHERLRELTTEKHYDIISVLGERLDCIGTGWQGVLNAIADEIEKCYIPRPRFEDGEPVQFGEEYETTYGKPDKVSSFHFGENRWHVNSKDHCGKKRYGEKLKRPTKVLDADEVEIKVGDTVYSIYNGSAMKVEQIRKEDKQLCGKDSVCCGGGVFFCATEFTHEKPVFDAEGVRICKGDTVWGTLLGDKHEVSLVKNGYVYLDDGSICFEPNQLTHKQPVFDADDVRICKGDTVWHVGDSSRGTVIGVIIDSTWHGYPVKVAWDKGDEGFYQSDALTHQEPDSLKRLLNDIREYLATSPVIDSHAREWEDRLADLIERGA